MPFYQRRLPHWQPLGQPLFVTCRLDGSLPSHARLVVEALHYGPASLRHYPLHAFVVMANHLHLLINPQVALPKLLQWLKGITAQRANKILGLTGQAFWQEESYDH